MKLFRVSLVALALVAPALPVVGEDTTTVVYVFPTSPSTFVPIAGLPSFVAQPGAPLPAVPTYVVHTVPLPAVTTYVAAPNGDLDCAQLTGTVLAPAPDPFDLDRDGDGVGCEPEDR